MIEIDYSNIERTYRDDVKKIVRYAFELGWFITPEEAEKMWRSFCSHEDEERWEESIYEDEVIEAIHAYKEKA